MQYEIESDTCQLVYSMGFLAIKNNIASLHTARAGHWSKSMVAIRGLAESNKLLQRFELLRFGISQNKNSLYFDRKSFQLAKTAGQSTDSDLSCSTLRLQGGSPQLNIIVGTVFLSILYSCIRLAKNGNSGSLDDPNEGRIRSQTRAKCTDQPVKSSSPREFLPKPSDIISPSLDSIVNAQSSGAVDPMKMVLVVRSDLRMSTGKVTPKHDALFRNTT